MANPPCKKPVTSPKSVLTLNHDTGIATDWSREEQVILENGLVRYSSEPNFLKYLNIGKELPNKNVKDIAMRCRWLQMKENHNKEVNGMVVDSKLDQEHENVSELLRQNEECLDMISKNLESSKLDENLTLFDKSRRIMKNLLSNLNENMPEMMKFMPPLPDILSDDLLDSILHPPNSNPPRK